MIQAHAPAKVLLCGEHAVLYGAPAIAIAVQRFATTQIVEEATSNIVVSLCDLRSTMQLTRATLRKVHGHIVEMYKRFLSGEVGIKDVVSSPGHIFQFALISFLDECEIALASGCSIRLSSTIPIGCGMGSSAATIVSFIRAIMFHFHIEKAADWLEHFICGIEQVQHGRSSGVDTFISLHGGCALFQTQEKPRALAMPSMPIWIIVTGSPCSTTGESVSFVRARFGQDTIWKEFYTIASAMEEALTTHNVDRMKELFHANEELLERIGVVPQKVAAFIATIRARGGAAKISGAGAISGDNGGVVLAIMDESIQSLCVAFGYECFPLQGASHGATVYRC